MSVQLQACQAEKVRLRAELATVIEAGKRMTQKCGLQNHEQVDSYGAVVGAIGMIESEYVDLRGRYLKNRKELEVVTGERDRLRLRAEQLAELVYKTLSAPPEPNHCPDCGHQLGSGKCKPQCALARLEELENGRTK